MTALFRSSFAHVSPRGILDPLLTPAVAWRRVDQTRGKRVERRAGVNWNMRSLGWFLVANRSYFLTALESERVRQFRSFLDARR